MLYLSFHTKIFMKGVPVNEHQYIEAKALLFKILETQQVIQLKGGFKDGEIAAEFCAKFIESHVAWKEKTVLTQD